MALHLQCNNIVFSQQLIRVRTSIKDCQCSKINLQLDLEFQAKILILEWIHRCRWHILVAIWILKWCLQMVILSKWWCQLSILDSNHLQDLWVSILLKDTCLCLLNKWAKHLQGITISPWMPIKFLPNLNHQRSEIYNNLEIYFNTKNY